MSKDNCLRIKELFQSIESIPYVIFDGLEALVNDKYRELVVLVHNKPEFVIATKLELANKITQYEFKRLIGTRVYKFYVFTPEDRFWGLEESNRLLKGRIKYTQFDVYGVRPSEIFWSFLSVYTYHIDQANEEVSKDYLSKFRHLVPLDFNGDLRDRLYCHNWLVSKNFIPEKPTLEKVYFNVPGL